MKKIIIISFCCLLLLTVGCEKSENDREDFIGLYGFKDREELEMFKLLISISGVGAKAALSLLSISRINNLKYAIIMEDDKHLCRAPGIGKKTAGRIILELKDKISIEDTLVQREASGVSSTNRMESAYTNEAVEALVALGYSSSDALKAIKNVPNAADLDVESLLKVALKNIF